MTTALRPSISALVAFALVAIASVLLPRPAAAHPHVFIDARSEVVFDDKGLAVAVRHVWRFDEAFSAFASQGLDLDGDGKLSRDELAPLAKVNVESLKDYDYFSFLRTGAKRVGFQIPKEYWLEASDDGLLTLFFTLPLMEPVKAGKDGFTLDVFDPSYFVDFTLVETDPAGLVSAPATCTFAVKRKGDPDAASASVLKQIPMSERNLPPELQAVTQQLANRITVKCP